MYADVQFFGGSAFVVKSLFFFGFVTCFCVVSFCVAEGKDSFKNSLFSFS